MKILTEPKVAVIAEPFFLEGAAPYQVPPDGTQAVRLGAYAAKGCYDAFGPDGRACTLNQMTILEHRHGSVLEHLNFTLFIEGITRALTLEMNRHRHFAISQRSTRYTAEEDAAIVLEPFYADIYKRMRYSRANRFESMLLEAFIETCERAVKEYASQVELLMGMAPPEMTPFERRKWARGKARNVLPHALETRVTYTGNVRAWRWFLESRGSKHAEPEIRRLAFAVHQELMKTGAYLYFEDFDEVNGELIPEYHKV